MKKLFFDFEVFPNWWAMVSYELEEDEYDKTNVLTSEFGIRSKMSVITSRDENARDCVVEMLQAPDTVVIGYNIKAYDLIIANAIWNGFDPQHVRFVSDLIINPQLKLYGDEEYQRMARYVGKYNRLPHCVYQDLVDDSMGGLKEKEAAMGMRIQESSIPFDKQHLTDNEMEEILDYCKHDVYACVAYYYLVAKSYIDNKLEVAREFGISEADAYISTNATVACRLLKVHPVKYFVPAHDVIEIPERVKIYLINSLPVDVLSHVCRTKEKLETTLYGNHVSFSDGGLHSVYINNLYVEADNEYEILCCDASSYYPTTMLSLNCMPKPVCDYSTYRKILTDRLMLKNKADKTDEEIAKVNALKMVCNSVYGAMANEFTPLYDPITRSRICRVDQLLLAALACNLTRIEGVTIIQANTDGLIIYLPRNKHQAVIDTCNEWAYAGWLTYTTTNVKRLWQKNVNSYLMECENGTIKNKGRWLNDTVYNSGDNNTRTPMGLVCAKAAIAYLLHNKSISGYIKQCDNVFDFSFALKRGHGFIGMTQVVNGKEVDCGNYARVVATTIPNHECLFKYKIVNGKKHVYHVAECPNNCLVINGDITEYGDGKALSIDKDWYINKANELIGGTWKQLAGTQTYKIQI